MPSISGLPDLQRIVTTHDSNGKAIVDKSVGTTAPFDDNVVNGTATFSLGYTTAEFPVDLNKDKDLNTYKEYLINPPGLIQSKGTVCRIVVRLDSIVY